MARRSSNPDQNPTLRGRRLATESSAAAKLPA